MDPEDAAEVAEELFCQPCNVKEVEGVQPFQVKLNCQLGLFICAACNIPLDCSHPFQQTDFEKINRHFRDNHLPKTTGKKGGTPGIITPAAFIQKLKTFYSNNVPAGAPYQLKKQIEHIYKPNCHLDSPIEGLGLIREGVRMCIHHGCFFTSISEYSIRRHRRDIHGETVMEKVDKDELSTVTTVQKWPKGKKHVYIPVTAPTEDEEEPATGAPAPPQFQQLSDEEKVKQIMEKIIAPPDAEQRNQSITSNDLSSFEVFADWDNILKLTTTEDLEKKTRLASSDHEAHTEKDKVVILQLVQAWFKRAKNFAFDEMSPGYRSNERLYLDKKEEFRANQEGQTDYRYTRNAYSCVCFILLLCGMHREELDLAELVSLDKNGSPVDDPDSEEEVYERLANVGSWAILPAHSSSPSHQTLYDAASDFWKVVQSLADGRMPVNIQEEHVIVVQCLMEAIFCRQKVASEREHREPTVVLSEIT